METTSNRKAELLRGMQGKTRWLDATVERERGIDEEGRTVWLAFSSEFPVLRSDGYEILGHSPGEIRTGRLDDGAPVLVQHSTDDHVGIVDEYEFGLDRRGRAKTRYGRSARAAEVFNDIVDNIRRHVSVGYFSHDVEIIDEGEDGRPLTYRVTDWEPFEVSIVSVPADPSVGVGRSADIVHQEPQNVALEPFTEDKNMESNITATPVVDVKAAAASAVQADRERAKEIAAIGKAHGIEDLAEKYVLDGSTVDEFRMVALEKLGQVRKVNSTPEIGMSDREAKAYSFVRAIRAMSNPKDAKLQEAASFEYECSRAAGGGSREDAIRIPHDVLVAKRDLTVGTPSAGGYLKGTTHLSSSFIDVLRNKQMVMQMGAQQIAGLVGDVAIPKRTAGATAYWVDESGSPTEGANTFGQLALAMKTVGAYVDISHKLLKQSSPSADALVQDDIATVLAIALDAAALHGRGPTTYYEPTGIAATSGIGSVAGGTDGLAPTWAHIVELETDVAVANADVGSVGYLTNPKVRGKLRQVFKNATYGLDPIWNDGQNGFGMVNGYRAGVTNQVSSTLTKGSSSGVCSAIFFGNWADLIIALWGGLDLIVDPYSLSTQGAVRVVGLQGCDVGVRHAGSFSAMLDALTT